MATLNPTESEFRFLRNELDARPNHRFSAPEIETFLREILPQIQGLHQQGQYHGSISLDTLVLYEGGFRLLASDDLPRPGLQAKDDILALGHVALEMLTGQPLQNLKNAEGLWIWEDFCLVDDHLRDVINQMIENVPQPAPPNSVDQIMGLLNGTVSPTSIPTPPTPQYPQIQPPPLAPPLSQGQHSQLKTWHWGILGMLCGFGILAATIPTLLKRQAEAKQADAINDLILVANRQQNSFSTNEEFVSSLSDLEVDINPNGEHYKYNQYQLNEVQVVVTAAAQERGLKSYAAIIFLTEQTDDEILPDFAICQTIEASKIAPQKIQLLESGIICPSGAEPQTAFQPNGNILLALPKPEEEVENTPASNTLNQAQAVDIVNAWLQAKPKIFGPPFDRGLLASLATGECYRSNIGSIDWLRNNGYHYTYTTSRIENVWSFESNSYRPSLKVRVYEDLTLHGPNGIDRSKSGAATRNYVYYFAQDGNGNWKVEDYGRDS
ncbi:MAG: IMS domain-containing protein [Leptolyngbyaceae bacterium]|nr:IMS domain-containing protein [Leptolyngbyaceae bacterium]